MPTPASLSKGVAVVSPMPLLAPHDKDDVSSKFLNRRWRVRLFEKLSNARSDYRVD